MPMVLIHSVNKLVKEFKCARLRARQLQQIQSGVHSGVNAMLPSIRTVFYRTFIPLIALSCFHFDPHIHAVK